MAPSRRLGDAGRAAAGIAMTVLVAVPVLAALASIDLGQESTPRAAPLGSPVASAPPAASSPAATAPSTAASTPASPMGPEASGLIDGSVDRTTIDLTAEYDVDLSLSFDSRSFEVDSVMTIRNESVEPIDRLELNTIAARVGDMELGAVTVAGKTVRASVEDQTIAVPLGGILEAGRSVEVRVGYSATLRSSLTGSNWLFTRTNGIVNAYRWLPWVSRRVAFDRPNHGDPFVTPVSPRVRVSITSDRALVYATTGEPVSANGLRQTFEARDVRDFAFTAAPDYESIESTVGDTIIRVSYRPGGPARAILGAAENALAEMEPLVGPYPYETYDLAQSAGGFGMEAPGLTWIPSGVESSNISYLVTHETAHQWFYGIVGNDQANEPFADEAISDMLARNVLDERRASRCSTARLDLSIYRYSSACYYETVYIQGGNFLDDVRSEIGSDAFWAGIRTYLDANRWGLASTRALLDTLDDETLLDLVTWYEPRFPSMYE